jgi:YHS domain-containing protein
MVADLSKTGADKMVKDIVCGMTVDSRTGAATSEYKGETYYFCSKGCKAQFDKNPEKYVGGQKTAHAGH